MIERLTHTYEHEYANVHRGLHYLANAATEAYEAARETVRRFLNAASHDEIVFARSATEAINLVAASFGVAHIGEGDEIVLSVMEHHSNIVPWHFHRERKGAVLKWVDVADDGSFSLDSFERALTKRTKIVAITQMSNVLGTVTPIKDIIAIAHAHGVPVLVDGSQGAVHLDVDVRDLDADFYVFTGHKVYGPTGIGVLYGKRALLENLPPFNGGGEMIQDVTQRKKAEAALRSQAALNQHQALHDALTGLANRTLFRNRIEHAVKAMRRTDARAAVLVIDLDGFKEINDSLGHAAGDDLLVELGRRLEAALRTSDTVARLGGDEFGVLLPHASVLDDVLRAVERMQAAIEEPIVLRGMSLSLEASIGIALYPDDGKDVETLLGCADGAMYHAKEEKSGWALHDSSRVRQDTGRLTLMAELRRALHQRELVLYYQPKALLADGEVHSVEALLRWNHPDRGLVPPDDFIPVAQQTGLIKPLTLYVIDEALRQCRSWQDDGLLLTIAVNLSARSLVDPSSSRSPSPRCSPTRRGPS